MGLEIKMEDLMSRASRVDGDELVLREGRIC